MVAGMLVGISEAAIIILELAITFPVSVTSLSTPTSQFVIITSGIMSYFITDTSGTIVFTDIGSSLWVPIRTTTVTAAIG